MTPTTSETKPKQSRFADLVARAQNCELCPRMAGRRRVLGPANGSLDSAVVFIGEAPGRLGADRYGVPFYGDKAGRNFDYFLSIAGIKRDEIFVTNAVLCNPRNGGGNNDPPKLTEIRNCAMHLREILEIVEPSYVVTLGAVALRALDILHALEIDLSKEVGRVRPWNGCHLYPLFHPGSRALIWRTKVQQVEDYQSLGRLLAVSKQGQGGYA